jgi:hypothetical protein
LAPKAAESEFRTFSPPLHDLRAHGRPCFPQMEGQDCPAGSVGEGQMLEHRTEKCEAVFGEIRCSSKESAQRRDSGKALAAPAASGRYDCVLDPSNLYVIWDDSAGLPCMAGGTILAFATETAALETLALLNRCPARDVSRCHEPEVHHACDA